MAEQLKKFNDFHKVTEVEYRHPAASKVFDTLNDATNHIYSMDERGSIISVLNPRKYYLLADVSNTGIGTISPLGAAAADAAYAEITCVIEGYGAILGNGFTSVTKRLPYGGIVIGWMLEASTATSLAVDILNIDYTDPLHPVSSSIVNGPPLAMIGEKHKEVLPGDMPPITLFKNNIIAFKLLSNTLATSLTVTLYVTKNTVIN